MARKLFYSRLHHLPLIFCKKATRLLCDDERKEKKRKRKEKRKEKKRNISWMNWC